MQVPGIARETRKYNFEKKLAQPLENQTFKFMPERPFLSQVPPGLLNQISFYLIALWIYLNAFQKYSVCFMKINKMLNKLVIKQGWLSN